MTAVASTTNPYNTEAFKICYFSSAWTNLETKSEGKHRMASKVPTDESAIELPSIFSNDGVDDNNTIKTAELIHKLTKSTDKKKQFVIVTAGKAGVGKSTLVNNFLQLEGDAAFKTSFDPASVTTAVDHCDKEINGVKVRVIDMPGLHAVDSGDRTDKITDILGDLKGVTEKGADVVFYCVSLLNRLENVDYQNMDTLTKAFGSKIWERIIFVFTFADVVVRNGGCLDQVVGRFIEELHQQLVVKRKVDVKIRSINSFPVEEVSEDAEINTFNGIVGIPVSNDPGIPAEWRITLLLQVIRKCRKENIPALLMLNRVDWDEVKKSTAIVATSGVAGAALGTAAGAGIGAIAGGLLTAPIGGVGAVPIAAGGALAGAWIGTLIVGGSVSVTALALRIGYVIRSRKKIENRARLEIKEIAEREKKLAQKANNASQNQK